MEYGRDFAAGVGGAIGGRIAGTFGAGVGAAAGGAAYDHAEEIGRAAEEGCKMIG
jgi:hypothetical protein